jgi:hypothetical protein
VPPSPIVIAVAPVIGVVTTPPSIGPSVSWPRGFAPQHRTTVCVASAGSVSTIAQADDPFAASAIAGLAPGIRTSSCRAHADAADVLADTLVIAWVSAAVRVKLNPSQHQTAPPSSIAHRLDATMRQRVGSSIVELGASSNVVAAGQP